MYPNPANSFITVSTADENTITKYKIFDILGHEVMSGELLKESTINILKLTDGVYLLEIQGNRTKFVIDR